MVIDTLENAALYNHLGPKFVKAFRYLSETDFSNVPKGKYEIDGTDVIAIVNEYDTVAASGEQMEAHKKYIDVQYIVRGEELIGHDFLRQQEPSKAYDDTNDFWLFGGKPSFFSHMKTGMFAIFYPTDLHMPNIQVQGAAPVKKVVMKVSVG
ncbi:YhcH/YjgK/YiaL family protein [Paraflavitalea sp. CAU 1676]|uniref:YhcH/YjgK/YiaL family protein n=1 Tax=Paraflavitalea sp. CAU 1676 TaxID=3032598 RepID=UPI0023DAFF1E|nr:YhcH/YjgK/YiaL family protein [Paraflavitalea sp. CAU 1676]MDF2189898.1 YhcH/YjgK/YiaL family protein [Paraflavitalea sp. CAU 1676]